MTKREKEIDFKAKEFSSKALGELMAASYGRICELSYKAGAQYADENPDKKKVYTKEELLNMGFGFTLNGDIVTPEEEKKLTEEYIKYKKNQWIDKVCNYITSNMSCNGYTLQTKAEFIRNLRKAMEE